MNRKCLNCLEPLPWGVKKYCNKECEEEYKRKYLTYDQLKREGLTKSLKMP